jgi:hypothetical protein
VIRNALFGLAASEDVSRDMTRGAVVRLCECTGNDHCQPCLDVRSVAAEKGGGHDH